MSKLKRGQNRSLHKILSLAYLCVIEKYACEVVWNQDNDDNLDLDLNLLSRNFVLCCRKWP